MLRAETQVANARQNVIAARNAVELAKATLNNVMGIDVSTPLTVRAEEEVEVVLPEYAPSLEAAYAQRAEVKQARVNVEMSQRGVSLAKATGRPTLGLNWQGNVTADGGAFSPRAFQWNASAVIFIRFRGRADEGASLRPAPTWRPLRLPSSRCVKGRPGGEAGDPEHGEVGRAHGGGRQERGAGAGCAAPGQGALPGGRVDAAEVTDAQAVLTQAETNLVNARYDHLLARARYQRAVGQESVATGTAAPANAEGAAP